jgi:cardiolipin synthase A/B
VGNLVIVDQYLALAGSKNIDNRSLFINYKLLNAFHQHDNVSLLASWFRNKKTAIACHSKNPRLARYLAEGIKP